MITQILNRIRGAGPKKRPVAQLVGRTETFTLRPGRLTADLELTPQRENELLGRKVKIEKDHAEIVSTAMKNFDKAVSNEAATRDGIIEDADRTKRKALRRLYVEYTEIAEDEPVAAAKSAVTMKTIVGAMAAPDGAAPMRRRVPSVKPADANGAAPIEGGIPDKIGDIVKERSSGDPV